jgi:hypothetical protein
MKKVALLTVPISLLVLVSATLAHQPRIVSGELTQIENPEVSQAFYGQLKGKPDYYQIKSDGPFSFYVGILVPDLEGIGKDISVEIRKGHEYDERQPEHEHEKGEILFFLNGLDHEWTYYYEEFGGDSYYKGPELRRNPDEEGLPRGVDVDEGTYTIKVFSPDNEGKYVLVVGEREEFPLNEVINTLFVLPRLKAEFFGKSPWTAYFNLIGLFLLISVLVIVGIVVVVVVLVKRGRKKRKIKMKI